MKQKDLLCPICQHRNIKLWCTAKDFEYSSSDKQYTYLRCEYCKTIFIDSIPEEELHQIYPVNYYSFLPSKKNLVTKIKECLDKRLLKKVLRTFTCTELKVLDIGGGTGWICDLVKSIDSRIIATQIIDIGDSAKKIAEAKGHRYFKGILEDFETTDKFDLILMVNLIEHVQNPVFVLEKAASLLSPGGKILIKTPNTNSLDCKLFKKTYWGGLHAPRHWVIFSEKSFRMTLQKLNLNVCSFKYTQGGAFWAFSLLFLLSRVGVIKLDSKRPLVYHSLFPLFAGIAAAFDFVRKPFSSLSQMFFIVENQPKIKHHLPAR